jgi:hypothetical protein
LFLHGCVFTVTTLIKVDKEEEVPEVNQTQFSLDATKKQFSLDVIECSCCIKCNKYKAYLDYEAKLDTKKLIQACFEGALIFGSFIFVVHRLCSLKI